MLTLSKSQTYWLEFLLAMTEKEIKARYKHAVMGFLWVLLNPVLQMLVMGLVFQFFVPVKVDNYFLFLFSGLLPWNFFSLSLTKATPSMIFERNLIQKAKFPRESIVLSIILSNAFHFIISLGLLIGLLAGLVLFFGVNQPMAFSGLALRATSLILAVLWIVLLTSGLSLIFTTLNVRYRDVNFMVQALMPLWFYATPIAYTLDLLPDHLARWLYLNPLTAVTELFHFSITQRPPHMLEYWWLSLVITGALSVGGWLLFQKESKYFDDWL